MITNVEEKQEIEIIRVEQSCPLCNNELYHQHLYDQLCGECRHKFIWVKACEN